MSDNAPTPLSFDNVIPLPYRVTLFLQLGVYLWYGLLFTCYTFYNINCLALLNLAYSPHKYSADGHDHNHVTGEMATISPADVAENALLLKGVWLKVRKTTLLNVCGMSAYWACRLLFENDALPLKICLTPLPIVLIGLNLILVFKKENSAGQDRLNATFKRIMLGNIKSATMRTNDILLSDSLTSYAKVINDFACFLWISFLPAGSMYNIRLEAVVLSFPALVRIKQCLYEYRMTYQRQHLLNTLKYSAGLGPIVINMLIKTKMDSISTDAAALDQLNKLNRWWYFSSAVSSAYSFVWDVKMDWGYEAFEFLFGGNYRSFMPLRDHNKLVFRNYVAYYGIIALDFILRFIWVFKIFVIKETEIDLRLTNQVGNFLFGYDFLSVGFALLELLEILRRWLWCFLKLESDLVKLQLADDFARSVPLSNLKLV